MLRRLLPVCGCVVLLAVSASALAQVGGPGDGLLATPPTTPVEQFDAAVTMLKLSRPELARQYLAVLLSSGPDDATLFAIRDKHGTATVVQMSRMTELQPESVQLLDLLNTAARNQLEDPAFQDSLVRGLGGTQRERESALSTLRALDDQAVPLIIRRLAAGVTPEEELPLLEALLRLGRSAVAPLIACLQSPNEHLRTVASDLLGRLGDSVAVPALQVIAFNPQSSPALSTTAKKAVARLEFGGPQFANQVTNLRLAERLRGEALRCLGQQMEFDVGDDGLVPLWTWSDAAGTVQLSRVSPPSAALQIGEQRARSALELATSDPDAQALLLAHLLWRDVQTAGWSQPIPSGPGSAFELALSLPPALVQRTLHLALEQSNPAVALSALKVLSHTGSRSTLLTAGSPVLAALDAAEPRLQFAAAETVLLLDPSQPFPGAVRVVEILARALNSEHLAKSVVVDPNTERGAAIAGLISSLGFVPELATTGQQGFELAAREGHVELAVLHLNTVRWDLSQTLANLRTDPRTKQIPIAVYGPSELRGSTVPRLRPYRLVSYVDDASDPATLRTQLQPLIAARSVPELTEEQRLAQVAAAADWLRHIAEGQRTGIFPLSTAEPALLRAAGQSAVARNVLIALGALGKPAVQARMAEIALAHGLDVTTRRAALVQLAFHIQRYGRMLDAAQVQQVATAAENESALELRPLWAAVVGALNIAPQTTTPRLLSYPSPPGPLP